MSYNGNQTRLTACLESTKVVCEHLLERVDEFRAQVFAHHQRQPRYAPVPDKEDVIRPARRNPAYPAEAGMDREGLNELVDLAVDGLDNAALLDSRAKSRTPGGETYVAPSSLPAGSFSVASESLRDANNLDVHRVEEARLMSFLTVAQVDVEAAEIQGAAGPDAPLDWYIVDASWWRSWCSFVKGGPRPGPIRNASLVAEDGHSLWPGLVGGENYVGMTQKSFLLLSELYGADFVLTTHGEFKDLGQDQNLRVSVFGNK
jgi:hypothetical protein